MLKNLIFGGASTSYIGDGIRTAMEVMDVTLQWHTHEAPEDLLAASVAVTKILSTLEVVLPVFYNSNPGIHPRILWFSHIKTIEKHLNRLDSDMYAHLPEVQSQYKECWKSVSVIKTIMIDVWPDNLDTYQV